MTDHAPRSEPERSGAAWQESDSARFLDLGLVYTPRRYEIRDAFLDLIPATADEAFQGVEIGIGQGWLTDAMLQRFPRARMIGLDGSETMLVAASQLLAPHGDRVELRRFALEDPSWLDDLPSGLRCVVSSLVIHHLEDAGKAALFRRIYDRLAPGGALLIADLVAPTSEWGRRHMAKAWNEVVEEQSLEYAGGRQAYEQFIADRWNIYEYPVDPDEGDRPAPLVEQLTWLSEAGFTGIDVWWARAGHALFGGYRPAR